MREYEETSKTVPARPITAAGNGVIYPTVTIILSVSHRANAVEAFKWAVDRVLRSRTDEQRRHRANIAIDAFIVGKWLFVLAAWFFAWKSSFIALVVAYLLLGNVHSYFWHHLWAATAVNDPHRQRRRFVNLLLATGFSMLCYAYFYHRVFDADFAAAPSAVAPWIAALTFSIGNALTGATGDFKPITSWGYFLATSQLAMTFVFVAVLLSGSIPGPRAASAEQEGKNNG